MKLYMFRTVRLSIVRNLFTVHSAMVYVVQVCRQPSSSIQLDALISQIYFVMKLYMFRTVRLSIIRNLFTLHSAMVYVIQVCRQLSSRSISSYSKAVYKPVWHIPLLSVQWIDFWWWTDELSETCRVSWQNKFVKLVHLVGFITKKFVTRHGHMNVKFNSPYNIFGIVLRPQTECREIVVLFFWRCRGFPVHQSLHTVSDVIFNGYRKLYPTH